MFFHPILSHFTIHWHITARACAGASRVPPPCNFWGIVWEREVRASEPNGEQRGIQRGRAPLVGSQTQLGHELEIGNWKPKAPKPQSPKAPKPQSPKAPSQSPPEGEEGTSRKKKLQERESPPQKPHHRGAHKKGNKKETRKTHHQKGLRPLWIPPPTGRCPFGFPGRNQFLHFCRFALGCRPSLAKKKGLPEGLHERAATYKKITLARSPLTRKFTRTGWSSLRSLQPYPPLSAHTSLRATRYARWARSPRGGKGFYSKRKRKNYKPYI